MLTRISIALVILGCYSVYARQIPSSVPLEQVWALQMPGTKDIRKIDSTRPQDSMVEPIRRALKWNHSDKDKVGTAFIVRGEAKKALRQAYEVLTMGKERVTKTSPGDELWVCFFSKQLSLFVHILSVERKGDSLNIQYQFVPHETRNITEHFALVPIGKVAPGKYSVTLEELPLSKQYLDKGFRPISKPELARKRVCKPFEFSVVEEQPAKPK